MTTGIIGYPGIPTPQNFGLNVGVQNPSVIAQQITGINKWGAFPVTLAAGNTFIIPPGNYFVKIGRYAFLEVYDYVGQFWRCTAVGPNAQIVYSDGVNFRLCNRTGSVVGAVVTTAGSAYTAPPVVTAGGQSFRAVMGAAISTTITKGSSGSGFTQLPFLVIDPPPAGGLQAHAYVQTLSGGAIGTIVVSAQGAGYTSAPNVTVINAPGDTTGNGPALTANGSLTTSLIAAGTAGGPDTVVALLPTTLPVVPNTTVPTFTFTNPAGAVTAVATAIMCFTALTVSISGGTHLGQGAVAMITSGFTAGTAAVANSEVGILQYQPVWGFCSPTDATGSQPVVYGGLHQTVPEGALIVTPDGTASSAVTFTVTLGGQATQSSLIPI